MSTASAIHSVNIEQGPDFFNALEHNCQPIDSFYPLIILSILQQYSLSFKGFE